MMSAYISSDGTCVETWIGDVMVGTIVRGHDGFSFVSADVSATVYPAHLRVTDALNDAAWHAQMSALTA